MPKIEQRILVARHPVDDLRRFLADDAERQAVGNDARIVGDRVRAASRRALRALDIGARPSSARGTAARNAYRTSRADPDIEALSRRSRNQTGDFWTHYSLGCTGNFG